ncbi:hypothetical protein DMB42_12035 [Nonomuraea sp. WAC 01424]|uniref:hypothetical protein n=1 Tax=Nonomuraea sp. WAC 01424 TaxID=2203200 RepID=UPI000F77F272|nr:hypothetical protein [Nonomuraea sp. WAC 01424]RSN12899.1 hypothetical protein DMB42_12035 [Nonomuraea sp. WAC 01424]
MHDPTEPDRQEILSGPGPSRRAPGRNRKTVLIVASALVGVLAAGGAGYLLAAKPGQGTQQEQGAGRPSPARSGGDEVFDADEEATMGDATTDAPDDASTDDGLPTDGSDDSAMGDAVTDGGSDPAAKGSTGSDGGTTQTGTGKKPTTPSKAPQQPDADLPADGPAGELSGQCAKSGC